MDRFMDVVTSAVYKNYRTSCSILFICIHIGTIQDHYLLSTKIPSCRAVLFDVTISLVK